MIRKNLIAALLHLAQHRILRQIWMNHLGQMIVRRCQLHDGSILPDHTMTVARPGIKLIVLTLQLLFHRIQQDIRILRTDLGRAVIQNPFLFIRLLLRQRDKIAAKRHICIFHRHADTQCFQRRAPGIIFLRIVAEHCKVRRIAARLHAIRNGFQKPNLRILCQLIHCRRLGRLQRRPAIQRFDRLICHTVSQNHDIFHNVFSLFRNLTLIL